MSRYIDADALITDLNKGLWGKDWDKVLAEAIINEAPSINIVRCFECKHWTYEELCEFFTKPMCFDDFCSYGSRSEKPNNCEDLQDWKDRMWAEAVIEPQTEREGE